MNKGLPIVISAPSGCGKDTILEQLQNLEDKYYDQFSKMESAMAKLQSQQSYLSSLFGSAS